MLDGSCPLTCQASFPAAKLRQQDWSIDPCAVYCFKNPTHAIPRASSRRLVPIAEVCLPRSICTRMLRYISTSMAKHTMLSLGQNQMVSQWLEPRYADGLKLILLASLAQGFQRMSSEVSSSMSAKKGQFRQHSDQGLYAGRALIWSGLSTSQMIRLTLPARCCG